MKIHTFAHIYHVANGSGITSSEFNDVLGLTIATQCGLGVSVYWVCCKFNLTLHVSALNY